jgi:uncharacterized membrane protein YvbJ
MNPDNIKDCMRCGASLERGYSSRYVGNECKEVICFECSGNEELAEHMKTGIITTHFMMDCMMDVYKLVDGDVYNEEKLTKALGEAVSEVMKAKIKVQLTTARLQKKIKEFDAKVWFKGLQDQISKTKERGVSAKMGKKHYNFSVLTWTIAGRTMITIEDDEASVTAVADETSKESRTGLHGIRATSEQALGLLDRAILLYESGQLKFKDDKNISMI